MARSFDDLVEHLISSLAVAGIRGLTIRDLAASVTSFYHQDQNEAGQTSTSRAPANDSEVVVDRSLLSKVWTWLGRHPDVSIGTGGRYNETPLSEVEAEFPGYLELDDEARQSLAADNHNTDASVPADEVAKELPKPRKWRTSLGPRIQIKEERLYEGLCGHPPDPKKVSPMEFVLLSHIAAGGSDGVLQGEVVRLSGQDKHSVPKRTDALHNKGYIIKETVFTKGMRTSRLTLKKLVRVGGTANSIRKRGSTLRHIVGRIFEILAERDLTAQAALAEELNLQSPAQYAVLQKVIRRLEKLTLVKRVRMAIGPSAKSTDLQNFVQLLRHAESEDLQKFDNEKLSLDQTLEELESGVDPNTLSSTSSQDILAPHDVQDPSTPAYQSSAWNPDRLLPNLLVEAVHAAGADAEALKPQPEADGRLGDNGMAPQPSDIDEFGFPWKSVLTLQVNRGEATFQSLIKAVTAGNIELRIDEHIAAKVGTDLVLEVREDSAPPSTRTPRRARVAPPRIGEPSTTPQTLKRKRPSVEKDEIVKGRPRKYMRGTEKFWRFHVNQAQNRPESDSDEVDGKDGRTNTSTGHNPHISRPVGFDKILVGAVDARLPLPIDKKDIGEPWMTSTKQILERAAQGTYMSPLGRDRDNFRKLSRVMIIKNPRLTSVDFTDRSETHSFRLIASSASHSYAYQRYYPKLLAEVHPPQRSFVVPRRPTDTPSAKADKHKKSGPRLGVFYEDPAPVPTMCLEAGGPVQYEAPIDISYETADEEALPPMQKGRKRRKSSTTSTRDISPSEQVIISEVQEAVAARRQNANIRENKIDPAALLTSTLPARSSRKRKLTEKAIQMLGTKQGRGMRLFSETRSVTSTEPTVEHTADQGTTSDVGHEGLDGIETTKSTTEVIADEGSNLEGGHQLLESDETTLPDAAASLRFPKSSAAGVVALAQIDINITQEHSVPDQAELTTPMTSALPKQKAPRRTGKQPSQDKQKYTRGANDLCRKIVLQLVQLAGGASPSDSYTLRRIGANRWQEAGEEDVPLNQAMKNAVKSLCYTGKLKQSAFSWQTKAGATNISSVIFLPDISLTSYKIDDVKQKIIEADGTDYVPPQWDVEAARTPLVNKKAPRKTPEVEEHNPKSRRASSSTIEERSAKRRRAPSAASEVSISSIVSRSTRERSQAYSEPLSQSAASCFLTLKIPSLRSLPIVLHEIWRSECPVKALLTDASIENPWRPRVAQEKKRAGRKPKSQSIRRSILWQNFPSSVENVLELPDLRLSFLDLVSEDKDWQRFACELEGIRAWEEQDVESALSKRSRYAFINHTVPEGLYVKAELPSRIEFTALVRFDQDGLELEDNFPSATSWSAFADALHASPEESSHIAGADDLVSQMTPPLPSRAATPTEGLRRTSRAPKRKIIEDNAFFDPELEADAAAAEGLRRTSRAPKRKVIEDNAFFDPALEAALEPAPKRQKKSNKVAGEAGTPTPKRRYVRRPAPDPTAPKLTQGDRWVQNMPEDRIQHLIMSVVVVRTLAGGIDGSIDWAIVMTLFPNHKEHYVKTCWEVLSARHDLDINNLTGDLQHNYIEDLEAGGAPSVNFEDVKATDWGIVVEWASKTLGHFSKQFHNVRQAVELPESRTKMLESYTMAFDEPKHFHNVISHSSLTAKETTVKSLVFGTPHSASTRPTPVEQPSRFEAMIADPLLHTAKCWALSAILTPPSTFDPHMAHKKLSKLASSPAESDRLLRQALKLLEDEKLVQKKPPSRQVNDPSGLRTWEAHSTLLSRFDSLGRMTPSILRRAREHKLDILDSAFVAGDTVMFEKEEMPQDGEMVAVLNLMSMRHVKVRPGPDVPKGRYGIDHERIGYQARNINKKLLGFAVEITPTDDYVLGDPKAQARQTSIPRGRADEERGGMPPWVDIHGNVNRELWETFLTGVLGLVVQMPGVSAADVSKAFESALETAEVDLITAWAVEGGFLRKDEGTQGFLTRDWWWLCIDGSGQEGEL